MSVSPFSILLPDGHLAAERPERVAKRHSEPRGVRIAIVYGHHAPQVQFIVSEIGNRLRLMEAVAGRAEIAGVVVGARVAGKVRRERRRGRWPAKPSPVLRH